MQVLNGPLELDGLVGMVNEEIDEIEAESDKIALRQQRMISRLLVLMDEMMTTISNHEDRIQGLEEFQESIVGK